MSKKKYYRVAEAAELLQVSPITIRRYTNDGKLDCERNPGGQRVFTLKQLAVVRPELLEEEEGNNSLKTVYYLRASDGKQALLDSQLVLLKKAYGNNPDLIIKDKASGLNEKRPGLKRIIRLAEKGKLDRVYITEKDRLTRFGYSYLQRLLENYQVDIIVLGEGKTKSPQEELIQDFLSLLASFSGKYYRLRGYQQKKEFLNKIEKEVKVKK